MIPSPAITLARISALAAGGAALGLAIWIFLGGQKVAPLPQTRLAPNLAASVAEVDAVLRASWAEAKVAPTPAADALTLARRLSFALTGAPPSLEEIRRLEALPQNADPVLVWLDHLLADRRSADYLAERLARTFVGVETGPFLIYRRRRLVHWLGDQLAAHRPYDAIVRDLIASEGLWTTKPETNFVSVTIVANGEEVPDEVKLAARTSRAFLGISLDCVQCHDDAFGDRWKQSDFHHLAAFYAQAEMNISGLRDNKGRQYHTRYLGEETARLVSPQVPFAAEDLPARGTRRERLAAWVTAPGNGAFARATVNRAWALLCGRPLVEPIDNLALDGPFPPALETLARQFEASGYDYQQLLRTIALSSAFRRDSRSGDPAHPVTLRQEEVWAAFPVTPLRSEQVAGAVIQSSSLASLDGEAPFLQKLRRSGEIRDFVRRFGDAGEDELSADPGTVAQRLLVMNGKLVRERTEPNPLLNASTRLARHAPSDEAAIAAAFLAALTRYPEGSELAHFSTSLAGTKAQARDRALSDLCWALANSTEFSWNR